MPRRKEQRRGKIVREYKKIRATANMEDQQANRQKAMKRREFTVPPIQKYINVLTQQERKRWRRGKDPKKKLENTTLEDLLKVVWPLSTGHLPDTRLARRLDMKIIF